MQKKRTPKPRVKKVTNEIKPAPKIIQNNYNLLQGVLGYNGYPEYGNSVSQVDTLFQSNRWQLLSNLRQLLSELYVENGIVQTLVNVPVDDALRGGLEIKTKQLEPEEIEKLKSYMDRENDLGVLAEAYYWVRLFGGGGIVIITDQDWQTPLNIGAIKEGKLKFKAADLWELFSNMTNVDGEFKEDFNAELHDFQSDHYDYYGRQIDKTRVIKLMGLKPPSFVRPRMRGWGFSVLESVVRSINQFIKATNLTFEVLDEFKVDYFKIKGLANTLLSPTGSNAVQNRIADANQTKNFQNAVVMDAEDDFEQKELSFAGIAETMTSIRMQIASDLRMPLTKVFGVSAAGFSSGEDDIENYNAMIESSVRSRMQWDAAKMVELRCQELYGFIPDDLAIGFMPLRVMSSEQEENVKNAKFARAIQAKSQGEITKEEFRDICNKDELLSIQLDNDPSIIAELDESQSEALAGPDQTTPQLESGPKKSSTEAPEAKE